MGYWASVRILAGKLNGKSFNMVVSDTEVRRKKIYKMRRAQSKVGVPKERKNKKKHLNERVIKKQQYIKSLRQDNL